MLLPGYQPSQQQRTESEGYCFDTWEYGNSPFATCSPRLSPGFTWVDLLVASGAGLEVLQVGTRHQAKSRGYVY